MSYRPKIKINAQGGTSDFPLDAETIRGLGIGYIELDAMNSSGELNDVQFAEALKPYCIINFTSTAAIASEGYYHKTGVNTPSGYLSFMRIDAKISIANEQNIVAQYYIRVNSDKTYTLISSSIISQYTNTKIDTLLNAKQDILIASDGITIDSNNEISTPKTLYNLGAYDTYVDNGDGTVTITRQTGYVDLGNLNYTSSSSAWYSGDYITSIAKDSRYNMMCANYTTVNVESLVNLEVNQCSVDSGGYIQVKTSSASLKPSGLAQIKLATSYTEKVLKNQPLNTLNASGSAWLQNEYNKTVNLYNINNGLNDGSNNWYVYVDFKEKGNYYLKINTTIYRLVMYYSNDDGNSWNILFDANNTYDRSFSITNTSYQYILYLYITSSSAINPSNYSTYKPMITKGSTPLPYQEYGGGEIAHKEDIEPVLLWENGSPRSSFTAKPISMAQDITKFKYLYIEVSLQTSSGQGNMIFKFRSKVSNNNYLTIFDNGSGATHSTRAFTITSTTNINVSACSNGNEYCIPLRIFGSNI